jgi:GLPGLI family protein
MLKGFGDQKYLIKMTQANWQDMNKAFDRISFNYVEGTKTIAGHLCKKATAKLPDGKSFTVYYAPDLVPVNKDFQYMNRSLPGLAMEYEASMGALLVTYSVSSINMNPVPQAKFDIPTTGYRVMTYDESRRGGK